MRAEHVPKVISILAAIFFPLLAAGTAEAAAKPEVVFSTWSGAKITFWIFGTLTVFGAVMTVSRRNPVIAALFLVLTLFSTGGVYLSLHAPFLAAMQVLVYAGAIMVLFIFVVMSVRSEEEEQLLSRGWLLRGALGGAAIVVLVWRLVPVLGRAFAARPVEVKEGFGSVREVGRLFFSDYLLPFEAISILLLVAIVGAVMVSRRPRRDEPEAKGA